MYMGFFGAWVVLHATAAPPPTAGAAPTAMGWPAMFARTPAIPTRTCSQIVVILASVPLLAPAAAAVSGLIPTSSSSDRLHTPVMCRNITLVRFVRFVGLEKVGDTAEFDWLGSA